MHHRHRGELRRLLAGALVLEQSAAHDVLGGLAVTKRRAPVARADQLVAVPHGEDRFVSQLDRQASGAPELAEMMTPDRRRGTRVARDMGR